MDNQEDATPEEASGADSSAATNAYALWLQAIATSLAMSALFPEEFEPMATHVEARAQVAGLAQSLVAVDISIEQLLWGFASLWAGDFLAQADAPNVRARLLAQKAGVKRQATNAKHVVMAQVKAQWEQSRGAGELDRRGAKTQLANVMAERFDLDPKHLMTNFNVWEKEATAGSP